MTPEELYSVWAPPESIWSQWVIPVPFAQITCLGSAAEIADYASGSVVQFACDLAVVADLPGGESIRFGLRLARAGWRPVPVIDGSPGPWWIPVPAHAPNPEPSKQHRIVVVDMTDLLRDLCGGAAILTGLSLQSPAPPAFLLDSLRMSGELSTDKEMFDNRWKVFPQDFPSARFLKANGIRRVLLVQENAGQPQEDLAHVLLRWEEAGLEIVSAAKDLSGNCSKIRVAMPSRFRASWYRGLEILGLRRNSVGGFGAWPYQGTAG